MRATLSEIYRVTQPVWDEEGDATAYRALSDRDKYVHWLVYEVIFYAGLVEDKPAEDALDAAVLEFAEEGIHYPEHLVNYARSQAHAAYLKALRKGETDEWIDACDERLEALS